MASFRLDGIVAYIGRVTVTQPTTKTTTTVVERVLNSAPPEVGLEGNPHKVPIVNIAMPARKLK